MLEANYFENTQKSILNITFTIIEILIKKQEYSLEKIISEVEKKINVPYEKIILSLNFLYAIGKIDFDEIRNVIIRIEK
ncbi:hypothetical protein IO418_001268 [Campylobacter lari]|nr:hypothetical protein [Campylobacter lari]EGK8092755.1 hypothetical protein [Campylobacter lari]